MSALSYNLKKYLKFPYLNIKSKSPIMDILFIALLK